MKSETYPEKPTKEKTTVKEILMLVLTAIPLAIGVAITVLSIIGEMDIILVGISIACLGLLSLIKR